MKVLVFGFNIASLDRKAVPATIAVRRVDVSAIEIEAVCIELRGRGGTRPVDATEACVSQRANSHTDKPATS